MACNGKGKASYFYPFLSFLQFLPLMRLRTPWRQKTKEFVKVTLTNKKKLASVAVSNVFQSASNELEHRGKHSQKCNKKKSDK